MQTLDLPTLVLFAGAIAGTFLHWIKEKYGGTTTGSPIDYLRTHPWNSLGMFGATFAACSAIVVTGGIAAMPTMTVFWLGFGTGYTADSALNRGPTP